MNSKYKALQKFGLNYNEIKIYLEALKHDELSPFKLCKLTGIPRTTVYDILMGLSLKGLVELQQSDGFTKQQTRVKAKNPSILRDVLQKKRKDLAVLELDILNILPELKGDFHKQEPYADFKFFPGIEGVRKVYSEEDYSIDLPTLVFDHLTPMDIFGRQEMNKMVKKETEEKQKRNYKTKKIIPLNDWTRHVVSYQQAQDSNYLKVREIRYIDNPVFNLYQRISVKGNIIRIMCVQKNELWGIVINSPLFSRTIGAIHQIVWQTATPLTKKTAENWHNEFVEIEKREKS